MKKTNYILLAILFLAGQGNTPLQNIRSYDIAFEEDYDIGVAWGNPIKKEIIKLGQQPALSPDGKKIAYIRFNKQGNTMIFIMDLNTREEYELNTGFKINFEPAWSSDNYHVGVNAYLNSENYIVVAGKDNKGGTVIAKSNDKLYGPTWAKDGKSVIYDNRDSLFVCNLSGKCLKTIPLRQLLKNYLNVRTRFMLTADESSLVYVAESKKPLNNKGQFVLGVFVTNLKTKTTKQLSRPDTDCSYAWLTAKGAIYYSGFDVKKKNNVIYRISLTDTTHKEILTGPINFTTRD